MCRCFHSLIVLLLLCGAALAAPAFDSKAQLAEATRLYHAGRYEESLRLTQKLYVYHPLPRLLFNIGQAYMKMGNWREALYYFETYSQLEAELSVEDRLRLQHTIATVRDLIAEMEDRRRAQVPIQKKSRGRSRWFWTTIAAASTVVAGISLGVGLGVGLTRRPDPKGELLDFVGVGK